MLTGRRPNPRGSAAPSASNGNVSTELDELTLRAVAPNPDLRPQSMALLAASFAPLCRRWTLTRLETKPKGSREGVGVWTGRCGWASFS